MGGLASGGPTPTASSGLQEVAATHTPNRGTIYTELYTEVVMHTVDGTTFVAVVHVTTIADGSEIVGMGAIHPKGELFLRAAAAPACGRAKQTQR